MSKYIILITTYLVPLQAIAAGQLSVSDLLDKYRLTQESLQSFIVKSEDTTVSTSSANQGNFRINQEISEFRIDGDRVDYRTRMWSDLSTKDEPTPTEEAAYKNFIWDGESFFQHKRDNKVSNTDWAFISKRDNRIDNLTSVAYRGAPLMGIFFGDDKRVDSIFQEADKISLRNTMDVVGGSACYVIDAMTPYGEYTVWIDPQHGYNISRAEVQKEGGDLAWGEKSLNRREKMPPANQYTGSYLPTEKKALSFSLKNVRFEKVNDIWIPMEADYEYIKTYQDNREIKVQRHHKRTEIDLEPNFEAIGAFIPDIPDGAMVIIEESPGIAYEWRKGKPVAILDKFTIDELEKVTQKLLSNTKVLSAVKSNKENSAVESNKAIKVSHLEKEPSIGEQISGQSNIANKNVIKSVPGASNEKANATYGESVVVPQPNMKKVQRESSSEPSYLLTLKPTLIGLLIIVTIGGLAYYRFNRRSHA
jgi:hypothetical protein